MSYVTLGVQEGPPPTLKETLGIIINGLHDLGPVQTLDSFSVLDVTGTEWVWSLQAD